jgi:hypothetical protein
MANTPNPNVEIQRRVDAAAQTVEETEMVGGKPHGTRRIWSSTGIQIGMAEFQRGLLHGRCLVWFDDGRLYIESSYFEGRLDGDYRSFWPNGKAREIGHYADGKRTGLYQWFDETGKTAPLKAPFGISAFGDRSRSYPPASFGSSTTSLVGRIGWNQLLV